MQNASVKKIIDAIGEKAILSRVGVKHRSLRLARERGVFPASWYPHLKDLCATAKVECEMNAFNWKTPNNAPTLGAENDAA